MSFGTMLSAYSFVLFAAVVCANSEDYLPPYIEPCDFNDPHINTCIWQEIEKCLPLFAKGIPKLGVASIDPVKLEDIIIDGNGLKLIFTEAAMHGLSNVRLNDLNKRGKKDAAFKLEFKGNLSLTAKYDADGKILILPIKGNGDAKIYAQNVVVTIDSKLTQVKDAKGEHLKLITPTYKYTIEKTTFILDNLFNGNKQLSDTTHQFANENWQQLMDDLAPPAIKQIVKTSVKAINTFFSKVTIDQIVKNFVSSR